MSGSASKESSDDAAGMTLRKSTRILRKSVPSNPTKAASTKKAVADSGAQSDQPVKREAEGTNNAEKETGMFDCGTV